MLDIHERGDGVLPPPWYRPPAGVTKGPMRTRASIIAGLVIHNDEGRRWYYEKYNVQLSDSNRSQDVNVNLRLRPLLSEEGIDAHDICFAPRRMESRISDFLIITQIDRGPFTHDGPEAYEEVYDEGLKPVEGVKEAKVKAQLLAKFGMHRNRVHKSLPIENFQESRHVDSSATTPIGTGDTGVNRV